jgi:hypothetical protein
MQNTNVYKIKSYAVFSGFTNSRLSITCPTKIFLCRLRLQFPDKISQSLQLPLHLREKDRSTMSYKTSKLRDGLIDMCIPVYQLYLKRRGYSIFFYFPGSLLWPRWLNDLGRWNTSGVRVKERTYKKKPQLKNLLRYLMNKKKARPFCKIVRSSQMLFYSE